MQRLASSFLWSAEEDQLYEMSLQLWQQNESKLYFDYVCPFFITSVKAFWILIFGSEFDFPPVWKGWFILEQIYFLFTWFTQWNLGRLDFTRSSVTGTKWCAPLSIMVMNTSPDIYFPYTSFLWFSPHYLNFLSKVQKIISVGFILCHIKLCH